METRNSSFEDHLNIVESAHSKTAGVKNTKGESLLDKIAHELNLGEEEKVAEGGVTAPGAPTAEGEVTPAASSVAGASPAVVGATEAVATPQTAIAGGNPQEAAAGEMPAPTKPNEGLAISAGDGKVTDANQLHKTPEAVAAAAEDGGGDEAAAAMPAPEKAGAVPDQSLGAEKTAEAKEIGRLIADSFQETLEKKAADNEYAEALEILKEAGLMEGYEIKDEPMTKEASFEEGCLEKIANKQPVSREDIVNAAVEYVELSKEAAAAEEQGRADARAYVAEVAENMEKEAKSNEASDQEKVASAINDPEVVKAVNTLKAKGIL